MGVYVASNSERRNFYKIMDIKICAKTYLMCIALANPDINKRLWNIALSEWKVIKERR